MTNNEKKKKKRRGERQTAETYWMEEVGLRSQRQQPETRLQVPGAHARVELLKMNRKS